LKAASVVAKLESVDRVRHALALHWRGLAAGVLVAVVGVTLPLTLLSGGSTPGSFQIQDIQVGVQPSSTAFLCSPGPCAASAIARFQAELERQVTFVVTASDSSPEPRCSVAIRVRGRSLGPKRVFLESLGNSASAWNGTAVFPQNLTGVVRSNVRVGCDS